MTYERLYEMLKEDHDEVKNLFEESIKNNDKSKFKEIKKELQVHMRSEEKYFYPKLRETDEKMIEHSFEEHREGKRILRQIGRLHGNNKQWMPKFKELKEVIENHVNEEEKEVFPKAKETLNEEEEREIVEKIEEEKSKG